MLRNSNLFLYHQRDFELQIWREWMTFIDTYHFKTERTIQYEQYEISDFPNVNEVGLEKSIMVGDLNLPFRIVYSQTPASSPPRPRVSSTRLFFLIERAFYVTASGNWLESNSWTLNVQLLFPGQLHFLNRRTGNWLRLQWAVRQ